MTTRRQPWDRQPKETTPAWEAFVAYRDMGATRSVTKVARTLDKSRTLIGRWSSSNSWPIRAAAWDSEEDRLWQLELRVQRRKSAQRNINLAHGTMVAVGQAVHRMAQNPSEIGPTDAARLMDSASKLERLALGEPTDRLAVTAGPEATDSAEMARALTDEERRARMEALRRELSARLGDGDSAEYAGGPAP